MELMEAIEKRRAYRALEKTRINENMIRQLVQTAQLAPSCYNHQPWRFVFIHSEKQMTAMKYALSKGNRWAYRASGFAVVFSRKDFDCVIKKREYFLFDSGMATAFLILKAVELGLVAHPIAGYDEEKVKEILNIPKDMRVITVIVLGKHSAKFEDLLSDKQIELEKERPVRFAMDKFLYFNAYEEKE